MYFESYMRHIPKMIKDQKEIDRLFRIIEDMAGHGKAKEILDLLGEKAKQQYISNRAYIIQPLNYISELNSYMAYDTRNNMALLKRYDYIVQDYSDLNKHKTF